MFDVSCETGGGAAGSGDTGRDPAADAEVDSDVDAQIDTEVARVLSALAKRAAPFASHPR